MYNFFKTQPDEILAEILKHLSYLERLKIMTVDKRFKKVIESPACQLTQQEKDKLPETLIDAICDTDDPSLAWRTGEVFTKNISAQVNHFKELFAMGADVNMSEGADTCKRWPTSHQNRERSLLQVASYANKYELAKLLIKKGANVNYQDTEGSTALHQAAYRGHVKLVKLLIDNKADPTIKDYYGRTAVDWAQKPRNNRRSQPELVNALRTNTGWEEALARGEDKQPYLTLTRYDYN